MKILQILPSLNVGGVERGVIDLARFLKEKGEETIVLSSGGELVAELQKMGIPHYSLPVHHKSLFSLGLVPKIVEIIQKERIEIVHARSRVPAWLGWLACRRTGTAFVTTCHGYYAPHFASRVMGWGRRVIAISHTIGRHMIDDFGVAPDRIRLIHRGVDLGQFPFRERALPRDPSRPFRIINVGRFSPIKGQAEFLHAIYRIRQKVPSLEVWLVGAEEKHKQKYTHLLKQTIRQLGLGECVKLLGVRRDIPELLADCDLLVLSTLVPEAFGRVLIEAGAVGTPVVATQVGGVLDVMDHGENGLLVGPGDTEAMAEAILSLIEAPEQAAAFAKNLRSKVESQFSLETMAEKTLAVYQEVKNEKKILILKLGALGDLILATPSFRMIRKRFPEASISLLVDKRLAALVSGSPYLNEVLAIDRFKISNLRYFLKTVKKIRDQGFDLSVDLQNTKWTHLLAALAGIPLRFGFSRGFFGFLLNRPDPSFDRKDAPLRHQFRILSKLGIRHLEESLELWPDPDSEKKAEHWAANGQDPSRKSVGLVLGSSPKWPTKRWPLTSFQKLADRLVQELNCRVVLIGSSSATPKADPAFGGENILNLVGKTSLMDLVSVIKRLDVVVVGDTAPLHIAGALQRKIVALFGPTDPKRHMPPVSGARVLTRRLFCQPCYSGKCKNVDELACLRSISVEEVFGAVKSQLTGK